MRTKIPKWRLTSGLLESFGLVATNQRATSGALAAPHCKTQTSEATAHRPFSLLADSERRRSSGVECCGGCEPSGGGRRCVRHECARARASRRAKRSPTLVARRRQRAYCQRASASVAAATAATAATLIAVARCSCLSQSLLPTSGGWNECKAAVSERAAASPRAARCETPIASRARHPLAAASMSSRASLSKPNDVSGACKMIIIFCATTRRVRSNFVPKTAARRQQSPSHR